MSRFEPLESSACSLARPRDRWDKTSSSSLGDVLRESDDTLLSEMMTGTQRQGKVIVELLGDLQGAIFGHLYSLYGRLHQHLPLQIPTKSKSPS